MKQRLEKKGPLPLTKHDCKVVERRFTPKKPPKLCHFVASRKLVANFLPVESVSTGNVDIGHTPYRDGVIK